eukprot:3661266-Rhodomonas_salina.1
MWTERVAFGTAAHTAPRIVQETKEEWEAMSEAEGGKQIGSCNVRDTTQESKKGGGRSVEQARRKKGGGRVEGGRKKEEGAPG